jgi:hypothetical protein
MNLRENMHNPAITITWQSRIEHTKYFMPVFHRRKGWAPACRAKQTPAQAKLPGDFTGWV